MYRFLAECLSLIYRSFEDLNGGVYAFNSTNVTVHNNSFKNVARQGKRSAARGQFVQFNRVVGGEVSNNVGSNDPAIVTDPAELLSIYNSTGTSQNYLKVFGNCLDGGGASVIGGGIAASDAGGSFVHVYDNVLIDPGQYGIAVNGGNDIIIESNKVLGRQSNVTNVGLFVYNTTQQCAHITVRNNVKKNTTNKNH